MSKASIDSLGDRLRREVIVEDDLRLVGDYRQSFDAAYQHVMGVLRDRMAMEPTGRPAKSTTSIVDKLRRESIRLSQMQDIAGARVVVDSIVEQDRIVPSLIGTFERAMVIDRRDRPSHGYRAVHVVALVDDTPVEIQIRTIMQHRWAELSEKMSDVMHPQIKYGGGKDEVRRKLADSSRIIAALEKLQRDIAELTFRHEELGLPLPAEASVTNAEIVRAVTEQLLDFEVVMREIASDVKEV